MARGEVAKVAASGGQPALVLKAAPDLELLRNHLSTGPDGRLIDTNVEALFEAVYFGPVSPEDRNLFLENFRFYYRAIFGVDNPTPGVGIFIESSRMSFDLALAVGPLRVGKATVSRGPANIGSDPYFAKVGPDDVGGHVICRTPNEALILAIIQAMREIVAAYNKHYNTRRKDQVIQ